MQNPAHTLVINWDADGNIEYRDLVTGVEGMVEACDVVTLRGAGGRTVQIYNDQDGRNVHIHDGRDEPDVDGADDQP